ncbi:type II toxin-antitoxin system PemK/MazF family toxin [Enterococcus hulanensis]|uniref:type II toxin-antitoxin system PemK/MazF family toxin n=1 Tax=Enterococcus TaxID=1350 RepID=UPI000B5A5E56|nr:MULTISPECIES: type II toxin-antitoxin system PemK/MazF family toxin [Enterococcus]MBO0413138.1 type II toxin-antitoxin system PemK/MazF family toxin [Enterococcus hulanensis]
MKMNKSDIATVYVAFTNSANGKRRPVYIIQDDNSNIQFFSITSKYHTKSETIKQQYVEIRDWEQAGLKKESWIDIGTINEIPKDKKDITWKKIGVLSNNDLKRLELRLHNKP